jgi:hypothetical protein
MNGNISITATELRRSGEFRTRPPEFKSGIADLLEKWKGKRKK